MKSMATISILAGCCMVMVGCGGPKAQMVPETATGLVELRHAVAGGKVTLEKTLEALEDLQRNPRLNTQQQVTLFSTQMQSLDTEVTRIQSVDDRIQADAKAHFAAWEAELKTIKNPDIAAAGQQRHKVTQETLAGIRTKIHEARQVTGPLYSNLKDINQYLKKDPTAEGIQTLMPSIRQAVSMKNDALRKMNDVISYIDQVTQSVQ